MSTVLGVAPAEAQPRKMLDTVKARGQPLCGVLGTITGFSFADSTGVMRGIDADSCRASASAVLGDAGKVKFVILPPQSRFTAVQSAKWTCSTMPIQPGPLGAIPIWA